jgi:signal transduction histidine kinase
MQSKAEFSGWFVVIGTASLILLLVFFFLLFVQYGRRRLRHANELLRLQLSYEQTLLQSQVEIQEQTFTQISTEIHDNIGQVLSLVRLHINTLNPGNLAARVSDMDHLLEKAIEDLRMLSHGLSKNYLVKQGLVASVKDLAASLERTGQYQVDLQHEANDYELPDDQLVILFRMVQEGLNNIVRHANAHRIRLELQGQDALEKILLKDDGIGFDVLAQRKGAGLSNLEARARAIGAAVEVASGGAGTTITITLAPEAANLPNV